MSKEKLFFWEPTQRWIRVKFGGEFVADSRRALLVWEGGGPRLNYYFPREDVQQDFLVETGRAGNGRTTWHVQVGDRQAENAAWCYETAPDGLAGIEGYVTFRWGKMDHWFEEEEEQFVHPRDPYKRIDTIPSSRHVQVKVDGVTVADTKRPSLLFETNLPTRYYIPEEDVNMALLTPTDSQTMCPYKGVASYWSVNIGDTVYKDIVWSYPDPIPETPKIKNLLCFYNEKVDIFVDDEKEERPKTHWS